MVSKNDTRNGHELAPLNSRGTSLQQNSVARQQSGGGGGGGGGASDGNHQKGVTIVLSGTGRGSIISRTSANGPAGGSVGAVDGDVEGGDRAAWSGKMQFFLSIIGYSVGLGNIWRFPYLCQQNGGGAFLIPFAIMLIFEGIPLFLIELGIGQRMRLGSLGVWNTIHPWLGGIGIASCIVTFFVALYYNVIITWCFYYLFNSFRNPLPWSYCPVDSNGTALRECEISSETEYFWYRTTLDAAPSMDEPGGMKWWIVLCLLLSWIVIFFIVMKGIQSSGKVVYFTSMFPYLVLTIFFIRGITLKGASAGLMHMYTPKVEKLLDPTVWLDAATQVFYSFGLAFGSLIAFGSYNPPKNNCVRDVILVSVCNALTAIYASVVIFAILGFKAMSNVDKCIDNNKVILFKNHMIPKINVTEEVYENIMDQFNSTGLEELGLEVCSLSQQLDTAAEGTGLAFIVFTQAIVELPGAPFWAVLFFTMLLSLGLGSQIGILEGMLCTIFDIEIFKRIRKQYVTGVVCLICFFIGLMFTTGAGEYWLKMFDSFAGTIGLVVVALLEMLVVVFVYGHEKFTSDIEEMTGYRPGIYWQVTWRFLSPLIMTIILISSVVFMVRNNPTYQAWSADKGETMTLPYPGWVMSIALCMILAGIAPIPLVFILRRFQFLKLDLNIHQGSIRRIDTTVSTKEMMADQDFSDEDEADGLHEYHDDVTSDDDDDAPPSMITLNRSRQTPNTLAIPSQRLRSTSSGNSRHFKMEVMDDF